jgi:lauroyl/myristoyl acyltransferase
MARTLGTRLAGKAAAVPYRAAGALAAVLPPGASSALADRTGDLFFLFRPGPRRALLRNLEVACGSRMTRRERSRLARAIFRNFARSIVDFLRLGRLDADALAREVSAEGLERLEAALGSGTGTVLLTCHIGGWEVGGAYLSSRGYPVSAVAHPHGAAGVTEFFARRREESGLRLFSTSGRNPDLPGTLERGECLAILGDWDASGRGTWATFFGRPARVPSAYVNLAARAGGRILPGLVLREPGGGYRLRLDEPIQPRPDDPEGALDGCLRVLERYISENVSQWFAFHPIWPEEATERGGKA